MNNDIRNLTKWLNEDQEAPINRQALARVLAMAEQPAPATELREQEPVAWMSDRAVGFKRSEFGATPTVPLYTSPPAQRTWVGLTDEEMNAALDYWSEDERSAYGGAHAADGEYVSMIDTWRYIEAKLREKNQ